MPSPLQLSVLAAIALAADVRPAAMQVTLEPAADNTIYSNDDGLSCGAGASLISGRTGLGDRRRALLRFRVADSIPAGSTIEMVSLTLTVLQTVDASSRNMDLHRLVQDWGEASSNCDALPGIGAGAELGDATWGFQFYNAMSWNIPGGDFEIASSATTLVDGAGSHSWSGAGLVADVQGWLDDPSSDFGWILVGDEAVNSSARRFASKDNPVATDRPLLVVDFTPPGATPGEAVGLLVNDATPGGLITLSYGPACGSPQHTIVYGPLSAVSSYGYSGQVCDIGATGSFAGFDPGPGSFFFLVVGHNAADLEGSYGVDGSGTERPENTVDGACPLTQDLSQRCD